MSAHSSGHSWTRKDSVCGLRGEFHFSLNVKNATRLNSWDGDGKGCVFANGHPSCYIALECTNENEVMSDSYEQTTGYRLYKSIGNRGWLYWVCLWLMADCLVVLLDSTLFLFGGQGMFFHSLPIALVEGMGFTILVPISTGVVSWFPLDFARVRHRQFNLFIVFTVVALLMVALNRPI